MSKSIRVSIAAIAIACFISCMVAMGEFGLSGFAFGDDEGQTEGDAKQQVVVTNIAALDKTVDFEDGAVPVTANVPETDPAGATVTYTTSTDGGETWSKPQTEVPTLSEEGTLKIKAHVEYKGLESTDVAYTLTCSGKLYVETFSNTKSYDGEPLTDDRYVATWDGHFVYSGDYLNSTDWVEIEVTGTVTDVGSMTNTCVVTVWRDGVEQPVTDDYKDKITINAGTLTVTKNPWSIWVATASWDKKYDGVPLTDYGYTAVWGGKKVWDGSYLCGWDRLQIEGSATITDAGTKENERTVKVWRDGVDVTSNYTIDANMGELEILKRQVTLVSASDAKSYDGEPLKNDEVNVYGDGFARYFGTEGVVEEGAEYTVTGFRTEVGESENVFTYTLHDGTKECNYDITKVEGILLVYKNNDVIWVATESATKMYDGAPLTSDPSKPEAYTAYWGDQEVRSGAELCKGDELKITMDASITDVDVKENTCTIKVMRGDVDVTDSYSISSFNEWGWLSVTKRPVTLTSVDDKKVYNGKALTAENVVVGGEDFVVGQGAVYNFTGSQTNAGVSSNCFYYTFKEDTNPNNYSVSVNWGKLEVTPRPVTLTSASDEKKYDGKELTNGNVTVAGDGFVDGEGVTYEVTGSQTNAGESDNDFSYSPQDGTSLSNYDITKVEGKLTVTPRNVTLTSASATEKYDGMPLRAEGVTVSEDGFVEGEGATYIVWGKRTNVGTTENAFTYRLDRGTSEENYVITKAFGTLEVTERPVTLTSGSATRMYNGKPLTCKVVEVGGDGFVGWQGLKSYTTFGSQTDAGEAENKFEYTLRWNTDPKNYEITTYEGKLTVTKRNVTLTSDSASKTYDGEPLTAKKVNVTGDGFAKGEGATYKVTGSQTKVGSSENTFTYKLKDGTNKDNYVIVKTFGTLVVK